MDTLDREEWAELGVDLNGEALGAPAYHPRALLSVWLYGFMTNVRSCRKLEAACRDQLPCLWLTGWQHPDHNTLWRFYQKHRRSMRMLYPPLTETAPRSSPIVGAFRPGSPISTTWEWWIWGQWSCVDTLIGASYARRMSPRERLRDRRSVALGLVVVMAIVAGSVAAALLLTGGGGERATAAAQCSVRGIVLGGGGTVSGSARVTCGETVTLTATAKEGYCFSHWAGDSPSEGCPRSSEQQVETSAGTFIISASFKPEPTSTPTPTSTPSPTPKTETALPYNLLTTSAITEAGSYSFLAGSALNGPPTGPGSYALLVHATDAEGTLQEDFYSTIEAGDRFDIEEGDDCFVRFAVTEVLPDLASVHTIKVFEVDYVARELSGCHAYKRDNPVTFRWHVAPGVEGEDGIRIMLGSEPTHGPGRYRIVDTKLVITIPAGMTLRYVGGGIPHGSGEVVVGLEDVESGSQLALGVGSGTEVGRVIETPPASPSGGGGQSAQPASPQPASTTRDVGALFDEIVKSVEIVP